MAALLKTAVFSGSNYLTVSSQALQATGLTVEMWVYPTTINSWHRFVEIFNGGTQLTICYYGGNPYLYTNGWGNFPNVNVPLNTWTHMAFVISNNTLIIYKNGSEVGRAAGSTMSTATYSNVWFGRAANLGDNSGFWYGRFGEIRLWKVPRSAQQIASNWNAEFLGSSDSTLLFNINSAVFQGLAASGTYTIPSTSTVVTYMSFSAGVIVTDSALTAKVILYGVTLSGGTTSNASTLGGSDGSIAAVTLTNNAYTAPLTYSWTSSAGSTSISDTTLNAKTGLTAGIYTLVVTDASGLIQTSSYTVSQPIVFGAVGSITNPMLGQGNGVIGITSAPSGGMPPIIYSWTTASATTISTQDLSAKSNLVAGAYTLTATDSTGVTNALVYTLVNTPAVSTLLQRFSFDGTIAASGSLAIAPTNSASTLGTPVYAAGPVAGTQSLVVTSSNYLLLPFTQQITPLLYNSMSFGGWVYSTTGCFDNMFISNTHTGNQGGFELQLYGNSTQVTSNVYTGTGRIAYTGANTGLNYLNNWMHYWCVYDSTTLRLRTYINGQVVFSNYSGIPLTSGVDITTLNGFRINGGRSGSINGRIADVRFYNGVVPASVAMGSALNTPVVLPTTISWNLNMTSLLTYDTAAIGSSAIDVTNLKQSLLGTYPQLTVPSLDYTQDWTIEYFLYPNTNPTGCYIQASNGVYYNQDQIVSTSNTMQVWIGNSNNPVYYYAYPITGQWNHVFISYQASTKQINSGINGRRSTGPQTLTAPPTVPKGAPINFMWRDDYGGYITGYMDGVRVSQQVVYSTSAANYTVPVTSTYSALTNNLYFDAFEYSLALTKATVTPCSANGTTDGIISATNVSGTAPFTYTWTVSNGGTTGKLTSGTSSTISGASGLGPGTYSLTVTDASANTASISYQVYQPIAVTTVITAATASQNNGSIVPTVTGGGAITTLTYKWTNIADVSSTTITTSVNLTGASAGTYVLNVASGTAAVGLFYKTVTVTIPGPATTLLAHLNFRNNILLGGSVGGTLASPGTTYPTPVYVNGPTSQHAAVQMTNTTYLALPYSASLAFTSSSTWSLGGWFNNTTGFDGHQKTFFSNIDTTSGETGIELHTGVFMDNNTTEMHKAGAVTSSAASYNANNQWNHWWLSFDGTTLTTWQNGKVFSSFTTGTFTAPATGWLLCQSRKTVPNYMQGYVSDVRFYNGALAPYTAMVPIIPFTLTASLVSASTTTGTDAQLTGSLGNAISGAGISPSYSWSSGSSTATATGLAAGPYVLTIRDSLNNVVSSSFYATGPVAVTLSKTDANGANTGTLTATATGMTAGVVYTYAWKKDGFAVSDAQALTFSKAFPGVYTFSITLYNYSSNVATVTIANTGGAIAAGTLLTGLTFNNTLADTGSLGLVITNAATTLNSPSVPYVAGPQAGTSALQLTTLGNYIQLPFHSSLQFFSNVSFSYGGWFNIASYTGTPVVMSDVYSYGNNPYSWGIFMAVNSALTAPYSGTWAMPYVRFETTTPVTAFGGTFLNRWRHFWTVYNTASQSLTIFIDGLPWQTATTNNNTFQVGSDGSQPWTIGMNAPNQVEAGSMTGAVANLRWYSGLVDPLKAMSLAASISFTSVDVTTFNATTGSLTAIPSGGTLPFVYAWSSGETTATISSKKGGQYTLVLTDAANLVTTAVGTINQPLSVTIVESDASAANGSATVTAVGGSGVYSYAWTKNGSTIAGATSALLNGLLPATYACTITSGPFTQTVTTTVNSGLGFNDSSTFITASWPPVTGATAYRIMYSPVNAASQFQTFASGFSNTVMTIPGLQPSTIYYFIIQSLVAGTYVTSYTGQSSTTTESVSAITKSILSVTATSTGLASSAQVYDFTQIVNKGGVTKESVAAANFSTGDLIQIVAKKIHASKTIPVAAIALPATTITLTKKAVLYMPPGGTGQVTNIKLSTNVVQPVTVNATTVVVNGITYNVGDSFSLDGQRVTVNTD